MKYGQLSKKMSYEYDVQGVKGSKTITLQKLNFDATADQVKAVADALASLINGTYVDIRTTDVNAVIEA